MSNPTRTTLVLSHGTARSYWLTLDPQRPDAARPTTEIPLEWTTGTPTILSGLNTGYSGFGSGPLEFLVRDVNSRRTKHDVVCHSCTAKLPQGSFRKFHDGLYIASPELCFLQMARFLSDAQLVELGINLCAKYYIDPTTGEIKPRAPITSAAAIRRYLARVKQNVRGSQKAIHALKWVVDNSASPKETQMELLFAYPMRYGGYGFGNATMNYDIWPRSKKNLAEQQRFSIDACWVKEKAGAEYYGEKEHQDHVHDRRRLDALEVLGWGIVVVDKRRFYSPSEFEIAAQQLAYHLKHRIRKPTLWRDKMISLRRELGLLA